MHGHSQQSHNHWGNIHSKLFKRALNTKKQLNGSKLDSRTAATTGTLQTINKRRKSKEILKKTQERLKKGIATSLHTNTITCKKPIQTLYEYKSIDAKCNKILKITKGTKERQQKSRGSLQTRTVGKNDTLATYTLIKTTTERQIQSQETRNSNTNT